MAFNPRTAVNKKVDIATDYSLGNPDTLTKYKTAAQISHKVLEAVSGNLECHEDVSLR